MIFTHSSAQSDSTDLERRGNSLNLAHFEKDDDDDNSILLELAGLAETILGLFGGVATMIVSKLVKTVPMKGSKGEREIIPRASRASRDDPWSLWGGCHHDCVKTVPMKGSEGERERGRERGRLLISGLYFSYKVCKQQQTASDNKTCKHLFMHITCSY